MKHKRIFIVDDDVDFLEELVEMLRMSGYSTKAVSSSDHVVELIAAYGPDLIIVDLHVDDRMGYEIAREVRDMRGFDELPIIAMTAYGLTGGVLRRLQESGVDDAIEKPFPPLDMIARIENFCGPLMREDDQVA